MSTRRAGISKVQSLPNRLIRERLEAGIDEVGRGCLAGPVVAAAVILEPDCEIQGLHDSKKLTAKRRAYLAEEIKAQALAYSLAWLDSTEVDHYNILRATFIAMTRAIEGLSIKPQFLLIDGNRFDSPLDIPYQTIVGGDDKVASISAASILAKVARDSYMIEQSELYPGYDWEHNMGYGTHKHLTAIKTLGLTPLHRRSFGPCQPTLFDF